VYIDEFAEIYDVISVSAGMRGLQILLAPEDYIRAVDAQVAGIAKAKLNPVRLMNSTVAATRRACAWNVTPRGGQILELKLTMPAIQSGAEERGTRRSFFLPCARKSGHAVPEGKLPVRPQWQNQHNAQD
jgi:hypothetical protein